MDGASTRRQEGSTVPKVTVIIPVYRRAELLGRALASVWAQTFRDLEVIVVDDGSGCHIAEWIGATPLPLKVITLSKNSGASAARNHAIAAATGELVAFLDHDDVWYPRYLAAQVAAIESDSNHVLSATDFRHVPLSAPPEICSPRPDPKYGCALRNLLYHGLIITMSQAVVRTAALRRVGPLDTELRIVHDFELYLRLLRVGTMAHVPEVLLEKYEQDTSVSRDLRRIEQEDVIALSRFFADPRNMKFRRLRRRVFADRMTRRGIALARHLGQPLVGCQMIGRAFTYDPVYTSWLCAARAWRKAVKVFSG